jgi:hypothetical protein
MIRFVFRNLLLAAALVWGVSLHAGFLYETNSDGTGITITGYTGSVPDALVIPTNINGLTVTAVGGGAFAGISDLTSVTIPDTVNTIGENAFSSSGLTSVTIPFGVTNISEGVFSGCIGLTNAVIPGSVTYIGQGAFGDTGLTSVTIPGSVTNFGMGAFASESYLTNAVISFGISSLQEGVFAACYSLPSVIIPGSVTNITDNAFDGCGVLTQVFFTGNAPAVDNTAFDNDAQHGFGGDTNYYIATVYYLPGTTGWAEFSSNTLITPSENPGLPTNIFVPAVLWNPTIQASGTNFGVQNGQYGFDITATTNLPIAIEACDDLSESNWVVLKRLTLTNGLFHFSEPFQTNTPARFYRIGFP